MSKKILLMLSLGLFLSSATVLADRSGRDLQQLIDELRALSDKSRKERAADRWLQRAMEDLAAKYDHPWRQEVVFDDFRDGDYSRNPAWRVVKGEFRVESGRGLQNVMQQAQPTNDRYSTEAQQPAQQQRPEDLLVGALFDSILGPAPAKQQSEAAPEPVRYESGPAEILLPANITNAFSIETRFSLTQTEDRNPIEMSVLQGDTARYGYRLIIISGNRPAVELERIRDGRVGLVESARLQKPLADDQPHELAWRHAPNGEVEVLIDGNAIFKVADRSFKNGYKNFLLSLPSGQITLQQIRITGT